MITLHLGDCLEYMRDGIEVDTVITDPVWPNCPAGLLPGCDNPLHLLRDALDMIQAKRVVIVMRHDSDLDSCRPFLSVGRFSDFRCCHMLCLDTLGAN